jgi:hypothetical protein
LLSHTRLEDLRYGGLCCPRRSSLLCLLRLPLGALPLHGCSAYRLRCYRAPQGGKLRPRCRCRDGSLLFHDGLCNRSDPNTPTGSWVPHFQALRTVHGLRPRSPGSTPALVPACRGPSRRGFRIPHRTDRSLARRPRRLCHGASTVGSPLPPATSYGAAWPLPRPDFHRQVHRSLQDTHYEPVRRRIRRRYSIPHGFGPLGTLPLTHLTRQDVSGCAFSCSTRTQQTRLASPACRTPPGQ